MISFDKWGGPLIFGFASKSGTVHKDALVDHTFTRLYLSNTHFRGSPMHLQTHKSDFWEISHDISLSSPHCLPMISIYPMLTHLQLDPTNHKNQEPWHPMQPRTWPRGHLLLWWKWGILQNLWWKPSVFFSYKKIQKAIEHDWLVVLTILKKMSSSMGFGWHPIYEMENKSHVSNHQPVIIHHY